MSSIQATLDKAIGYHQNGRLEKAETLYRKIVKEDKTNADAWHLLGVLFYQMGEVELAKSNIEKAIKLNPNVAAFYSNLGLVLHRKREYYAAIEAYRKALSLAPSYPEALNNLGNALKEGGRRDSVEHQEALKCYQKALQLNPSYPEALSNLANLIGDYGKTEEATLLYEKALQLNPDYKDAWTNLGILRHKEGRYHRASVSLKKAIGLPGADNPLTLSTLLETKRNICDWEGIETLEKTLIRKGTDGNDPTLVDPFVAVAKLTDVSNEVQLRLTQKYVQQHLLNDESITPYSHTRTQDGKIRIGYVSANLFNHATMHLIQGLFALHDRERFEVVLFALHKDEESIYFKKVSESVDAVHDLSRLDDTAAAALINVEAIDILIDLNGHTKNSRPGIFAYRPAPIQLLYLGFPGTSGCEFMDYIITDETITPEEYSPFYSEKFFYMPDCYQVNDRNQCISPDIPSKPACGLPEDAFVFCSFNNAYKIEPVIFDAWMEILRECEESVLWLLADEEARQNLIDEAQKRDVDPSRLIFAQRLPKADHLARIKNADVMLDTYYCNAHTTASDVLYAGIPLITCRGERMATRVAASILENVGLDACVTEGLDEYKRVAKAFYHDRSRLQATVETLEKNRIFSAQFDTERFARYMDKGLVMIWEQYLKGKQPTTLKVESEVQS